MLALTGCGGGAAAGGHGILFLRTPAANGRVQQLELWRPATAPRELGPSSDWILTPQWSPDGKSIAFADERGGWDDPNYSEIYVVRADGSKLRQLTHGGAKVFRDKEPSWSPDGTRIVFVRDLTSFAERLAVVDVQTGRAKVLPDSNQALSYGGPAWGKAGIVYPGGHGRLMLVNPAGGRSTLFAHASSTRLSWSPRGVLAALEKGRIVLFSAAGDAIRQLREPFAEKTRVCGVAWSPDGKQLVVRTAQHQVGLWTVSPAGGSWRRLPVPLSESNLDDCALSWR
ncbi:MAG: hypothetical protein ACRDLM_09655 [Gaiellaceae bacterium]